MLNTSLIDVATGERAYEITTDVLPEPSDASSSKSTGFSPTASVLVSPSEDLSSSSSSIPPHQPQRARDTWDQAENPETRQTRVVDASGYVVCSIMWRGRRPSITINDEKIGGLTELFGSSAIRFMPKVLAIPTRFDNEFVWQATGESLYLYDYASESVKGTFHQNCIRIPAPLKSSKSKQTQSSPKALRSKPSKLDLSPSSSSSSVDSPPILSSPSPKSAFIPTHLPGLGSNYLEFEQHPLARDIEIILSFIMMEILRRGRFHLTPYTFERPPSRWDFKEATKDLFLRRLRRNTV